MTMAAVICSYFYSVFILQLLIDNYFDNQGQHF